MTAINNISPVSFRSTYVLPFDELKKVGHEGSRQFGKETTDFLNNDLNNVMTTPEGLAVKVDDNRDKEYEAIIAKYGLNIHKHNGDDLKGESLDTNAYKFLVSKINPDKAEEMIAKYKEMNKDERQEAYMKAYKEFKASAYSAENSAKTGTPHITPTNAPILKYKGKDGENYMARPVKLDNGYPCIAVATEKEPSKVTLMNEEEFKKFMLETAPEIKK